MRPATRRFLSNMDTLFEAWEYAYHHFLYCTMEHLEDKIKAWKELATDLLARAERRAYDKGHCEGIEYHRRMGDENPYLNQSTKGGG